MKVLWFVSSLEQIGGGERFAIEAVKALRLQGHQVVLVCDRFNNAASFEGRYDLSEVVCTGQAFTPEASYLARSLNKARGVFSLAKVIRQQSPSLVVCQSEFDAIRLYTLSRFMRFQYRVFVFGQMFQFKTDMTRYAWRFNSHLETIVASRPGYRDTVEMPSPKLPPVTRLANELIALLKFRAIRRADHVFSLSPQVQWEVGLLYGRRATVCRAAFDESFIDVGAVSQPRPVRAPVVFLSISRLDEKKRIDLIIDAFGCSTSEGSLRIVGTGPDEDRLRALAASSARSKDIHFLGAVDDVKLVTEIAYADCLISMDIGDFDISVIEALAKGVRVIVATDFDMTGFEGSLQGIQTVTPTTSQLSGALNHIEAMAGPTSANLGALRQLTWHHLALTLCDPDLP